jgi:hypothetical protein
MSGIILDLWRAKTADPMSYTISTVWFRVRGRARKSPMLLGVATINSKTARNVFWAMTESGVFVSVSIFF